MAMAEQAAGPAPQDDSRDDPGNDNRRASTAERSKSMDGAASNPIGAAFRALRGAFIGVACISMLINILMLTGPIFMLQVYDRVLASGSVPTLVTLGGMAIALYGFYGLLEGIRGRVLLRIGHSIDGRLSGLFYSASTALQHAGTPQAARLRPVHDLDAVRQFLSGPGPSAVFDLPWLPFYLGIVYLFHPVLGLVALGGAVVICVLIGLNEAFSRRPAIEAAVVAGRRLSLLEENRRNADAVRAMGMTGTLEARWNAENDDYLDKQRRAMDRAGLFSTAIKTFRFVLQSAVLGVGAYLAIAQEITPGVMIAASILTSRALAPVEQAVSHWRGFVAARQALQRLAGVLAVVPVRPQPLDLPLPADRLTLEAVSCGPAGLDKPIVEGVSFELCSGAGLGIVGPSGSGKSTLARAIVGLLPVREGAIRLDGAELAQWPSERISRIVGYLPQDVQLFDGSVADNIARFDPQADSSSIIEAAKLADVHELIVGLPDGYNTLIGTEGLVLSGGQCQRIALARALYGQPFLVVLDEPNSNLDPLGEAALSRAIRAMRDRGSIVIVVAHRPSAMAVVDTVLCLKDGKTAAYGPKEKLLRPIRKVAAS